MRKLLLVTMMALLLPIAAQAQWEHAGPFPADSSITSSVHGLAVDNAGRVYVQIFSGGTVIVYDDDGVVTDTIKSVTIDGTEEALSQGRGLQIDADGNLLIANSGLLYRVATSDFSGMNKIIPVTDNDGNPRPLAAPAVDEFNTTYVGPVVVGDSPVKMYDADFNFVGNVTDEATVGFSRAMAVTSDGLSLYWAGYDLSQVLKYSRASDFDPFGDADTLFVGAMAESFGRNPATGNIWFSSGNTASGAPSGRFAVSSEVPRWYAVDPETDTIVDSLVWNTDLGFDLEKPRGIAFSPDGNTAYVAVFDANSGAPSVQKFTRDTGTAIERNDERPTRFALDQNYPNPFNPQTNIRFELTAAGQAALRVYDMLGREVATLMDGVLAAGAYTATFDAAELPSGTYLYMLEFEGQRLTGTMTLLR